MTDARRTWLSVAAISAVFSFIVVAVMLSYWSRPLGENPFDSPEWVSAKTELQNRPTDRSAHHRIRELDLQLRRGFFRRREQLRLGGTLLLIGLIVAVVAVKRANRRAIPEPDAPTTALPGEARDRRAAATRLALSITGLVLLGGAAYLWAAAPTRIPGPGAVETERPGATDRGPPTLEELAAQWPAFRGHDGSGVAAESDVPRRWDATTGENIAWMTKIPLPGTGSPVVWGDRVFLTGADARREEVYCIDAGSGAVLWKKGLVVIGSRMDPPEPMQDTGFAAPTAATDGRFVFVMFASGRVAAFDFEGRQVWLKSFGPLDNIYGHSSSVALFGDHVILQLDQGYADQPLARVLALDAKSGRTVWETRREVDSSWASPVVVTTPSGPQLLLSATPFAAAYDPATGKEIWRADVIYGEVAPSPIHLSGTAFFAQEDIGLVAIRTDGKGDVTKSHVAWTVPAGAPDVTSPVCDGERIYMVTTSGTLTCIRAESGDVIWTRELEAEYYSSPSLAGGLLYLTDMDGVTVTLEPGDEFREVGRNRLGERVDASPAFAAGRIYLRGKDHLFAIGGKR
jgi:outer membrane protein assembly factor BamB